ncbi:MAG: hypothetical protein ACRD2N_04500 [Vicinamibacterales bacterium]
MTPSADKDSKLYAHAKLGRGRSGDRFLLLLLSGVLRVSIPGERRSTSD